MTINIELPGCNLKNLKRELSVNFSFKSPCVVFAHFAKKPPRYTPMIRTLLYLCGIPIKSLEDISHIEAYGLIDFWQFSKPNLRANISTYK